MRERPWDRLTPAAKRLVWCTALVPPILTVAIVTPALLWYLQDSSLLPSLVFAGALAGTYTMAAILVRSLLRELRSSRREHSGAGGQLAMRRALREIVHLPVFGGIFLAGIYLIVFVLPLAVGDDPVLVNAVLVMFFVGMPIAYYLAAKRLGRWWARRRHVV